RSSAMSPGSHGAFRLGADGATPLVMVLDESGTLLVAGERGAQTVDRSTTRFLFWPLEVSKSLPVLASDPVVWDGTLYGRLEDESLVSQELGGRGRVLLAADDRPAGAVDGPITCASGVLLLGNYALDIESRRILWVAPDLEVRGPLIPAADGVVLYASGAGDLVAAGAAGPGGLADAGGVIVAPTLPGAGTAVVLEDGTRIPADRVAAEDAIEVSLASGDVLTFDRSEVCAIEGDGDVEVLGEPYGLVLATRDALDRALADDLVDVFDACVGRNLVVEARELFDEIRSRGYPESELRDLEGKLGSRSDSVAANRDRQLAAVEREEAEARGAAFARLVDAAGWLTGAGLPLEASAVLASAPSIWPGEDWPDDASARVRAVASTLCPPEFPWVDRGDAAERWLEWAPLIAPARARFVAADEMAEIDEPGSIWRDRTIGLRTRSLFLVSRSDDPEIVGACLRHGEAAVRTLDEVLDNPPNGDEPPLEVRIHRTRDDYLEEDFGDGVTAIPWSAGFYSPLLRASRFHVPDEDAAIHAGRQLHKVLAHELTHQYIAERWRALGGRELRSPATRGYWLVEGFARYVEDQSPEMGRRGQTLDDPTVQSVDAMSVLEGMGGLIGLEGFFEAPQLAFFDLPDKASARVRLRSTLVTVEYTPRSIFYEQAGALTFFLLQRCGDGARERYLGVLRDHYRSETKPASWTKLGFETVDALDEAFRAFLRDPAANR
ncbi:MAG: hypothetical protein AAGA20_21885, partial [Planctomycetota bacterium]